MIGMEGLVVYYSRTGNTKRVAESIADTLQFETREIIDKKDRSGFLGYMRGGWDAWREKRTQIERKDKRDLSSYDIIVIGTPVWAAKPAPAINTYLAEKREKIKDVAFFCTCGGSGYKSTFSHLKKIGGMEPESTLMVKENEIEAGEHKDKVKKFAKGLPDS